MESYMYLKAEDYSGKTLEPSLVISCWSLSIFEEALVGWKTIRISCSSVSHSSSYWFHQAGINNQSRWLPHLVPSWNSPCYILSPLLLSFCMGGMKNIFSLQQSFMYLKIVIPSAFSKSSNLSFFQFSFVDHAFKTSNCSSWSSLNYLPSGHIALDVYWTQSSECTRFEVNSNKQECKAVLEHKRQRLWLRTRQLCEYFLSSVYVCSWELSAEP